MSKVLDMAKRLEEAEKIIAELQKSDRSSIVPSNIHSASTSQSQNPVAKEAVPAAVTMSPVTDQGNGRLPPILPTAPAQANPSLGPTDASTPKLSGQSLSNTATPQEASADVSIDDRGALCYYGPTSAVHDPLATGVTSPQVTIASSEDVLSRVKSVLIAKAKESRMWEGFAISNATVQSEIPRQVISKLLRLNWTWTGPMFMWVYRPAFMGKSYEDTT